MPDLILGRLHVGLRARKGRLLSLILGCLAIFYVLAAFLLAGGTLAAERHIGAPQRDDERQLRLYVEALGIDAVNEGVSLRLSLTPSPALRSALLAGQDIRVRVEAANQTSDLLLRAGDAKLAAALETDLDRGTVAAYPLDRFRAGVRISARDAAGATIPLATTAWEGVAGWSMTVTQDRADAAGDVPLRLAFRRTPAVRFLVLALYTVIALIALAALTVSGTIFMRLKPPESTLLSAMTGMVFTLPALRYALPGSPPLGVRLDLLVFFWAELAVTLALMLFVATWARTGWKR